MLQLRIAKLGQPWTHTDAVLVLGNLDGVHRGHQAILQQARRRAEALGAAVLAVVFEPQPREFFQPQGAPARLTRFKEKVRALEPWVDGLQVLKFNADLAHQSAEEFVTHWLVDELKVRHLVVGDDFRFGAQRRGDFGLLESMGKTHGFGVERTTAVMHQGRRISSTWVRETLATGNLGQAETLLGRPYTMLGKAGYGLQLARTLGWPTANVPLLRARAALNGVFAVRVRVNGQRFDGIANLGSRPTVPGREACLEVHLFDFDGPLYGCELDVAFVAKVRDEQKFESLDLLKTQVELDHEKARALLARP